MRGRVAIAMFMRECGGEMADTVNQIQTKQSWIVMSIGPYDHDNQNQSMIWEDLCDSEAEAIAAAGKIGLAFVVPSTEVTNRIVRST